MKRTTVIQHEVEQIGTITSMTSVFEAIASIHIAEIRDRVVSSTTFFNELWHMYTQLRRGEGGYASRRQPSITGRQALVVVSSAGGLNGDIDERIVDAMLEHPGHEMADIYVVGAHGATLLAQRNIKPAKILSLPDDDNKIDVQELTELVNRYEQATVYYQTYVSLVRQEVARIDLFAAVTTLGASEAAAGEEVISRRDYIFEPSLGEILEYMESMMLQIAMGQIVLESKLAQYASRFNAMGQAKVKANGMQRELILALNRSRRSQGDERIKEVLSGMKVMARSRHGR